MPSRMNRISPSRERKECQAGGLPMKAYSVCEEGNNPEELKFKVHTWRIGDGVKERFE